ncbi:MAG: PD-(D/E)XK nuclease family protein [Prevotellaceae bacterium]|nr:PD-(D/E)XK nuclease family protein [Prevotellaceae bacterium]
MKSFLNIIAADMLAHFSCNMRDVTVVFPGKRAGMFLNREFALLSDKPVWTPRYCTMGDLFQSLTSLQVADPLRCVYMLHSVMQDVLGADYTETLDEFWSWGEVLMADFDDIDKHMADAKAIFTNITDQERLKSLDYLDDRQRETLKRFFGRFSLENSTHLQEKFLHTWSHMHEIYTTLRERLLADGQLWEGALFRHVAEQMQSDESLVKQVLQDKRAIVFAGFNVLNNVEHTMMSTIQREGKARFYWDYDIYYCDPKADHEAGYFMKQNLRDFPCAVSDTSVFDNFSRLSDVTFIACTSNNAAARYANTYITQNTTPSGSTDTAAQSPAFSPLAVVLANEALMQPVLHAIPESEKEVNVTMGFPVTDTPVYGILTALLRLQTEGYDTTLHRFRYPFEQSLRRQPFFELLDEEQCFVYHGDETKALLDYLLLHLRRIAAYYAQAEEPGIFEQLYSETAYRIDRMLCLLRDLVQHPRHPLNILPGTLRRLLRQMTATAKIPFHSEPDRGLQVMGVLETRCLDFEHLLLLSAEEGNLPRSTHANSFIPANLRDAFGLTTQRHRIAVYAYYFYRLIQRCEHLTCVYNESTSDGTQHEMSRFLRQMLAETSIPVRTLWLRSRPEVKPVQPLVIEKTDDVMAQLHRRYDQNLPEGEHINLSPSAINAYMACPMMFYLDNVLRIRREDEPEDGISADVIGNIFHDVAEFFYDRLQEQAKSDTITGDMLCTRKADGSPVVRDSILRELQLMLHTAFDVCWFHPTKDFDRHDELRRRHRRAKEIAAAATYKGTVLIARDVLLRYLLSLVRYDARHAPFRIIGAERERTTDFDVHGASIRVGGRIDRIDEMDGHLRIVDYKTGMHEPDKEKVKMENVVSLTARHERYYLQTFLYALAETRQPEATLPIRPTLFFPGKSVADDYDPTLMIDGEAVDDFARQHAETFREGLQTILDDIFDPAKPFACTTDARACTYCKLQLLCGKKQ